MLLRSQISLVAGQRQKLANLQKLARTQSIDYMNSLDKANRAERDLVKIDPALQTMQRRAKLQQFAPRSPSIGADVLRPSDQMLDDIINPKFQGVLSKVSMSGFPSILTIHGDIFESSCDSIVLPLPPNLHAYRGVSLRFLERAGPDFARLLFTSARKICGDPSRHGIPIGTVIPMLDVKIGNIKNVFFIVMPSYWQGTTTDARRRFRFALQQTFQCVLETKQATSLALPHLGRGVFGFDHDWTWRTIAEEMVESGVLQIGNTKPIGNLRTIEFTEEDLLAATTMSNTLQSFLGERSAAIETAEKEVHSTEPLVVLHTIGELNKAKRVDKVKFRKYSGIIRNLRLQYKRFIRPHLWRSAKMNPVPDVVGHTHPHFHRGVTHTLFPTREPSAFSSMLRKTTSGRLAPRILAVPRSIQQQSNPRL